jgi:hypothetical protein
VLADGMGLGKTFQTIASLYCLLTKGVCGQPTCRKPLILCPTSLVQVNCDRANLKFLHWLATAATATELLLMQKGHSSLCVMQGNVTRTSTLCFFLQGSRGMCCIALAYTLQTLQHPV